MEHAPDREPENGRAEDRNHRGWILLVEDNQMVREITHESLVALGFNLVAADCAERAHEAFRNHSAAFDLVMTDMHLPDQPGTTLLAELRTVQPDLPALLTSGYARRDFEADLTDLDHFIQKPYDLADLAAALDGIFKKS